MTRELTIFVFFVVLLGIYAVYKEYFEEEPKAKVIYQSDYKQPTKNQQKEVYTPTNSDE